MVRLQDCFKLVNIESFKSRFSKPLKLTNLLKLKADTKKKNPELESAIENQRELILSVQDQIRKFSSLYK